MTSPSTLARIRALVEEGAADLATIEAIRAVDSWWPEEGVDGQRLAALADVLNVLGVLRFEAGDLRGAVGAFRAATGFDPTHADAAANLADAAPMLEAKDAAPVVLPTAHPDALNPWTEAALTGAAAVARFAGAEVLEIGGAVPRAAVEQLGVARWVACELRCGEVVEDGYEVRVADAGDLPFPDESFDVVFSACAFEHFMDVPAVLREARRVLRPGGVLFTEYGPLWTHATGHHLYLLDGGRLLAFTDPVVPHWAHLLLNRRQLRRFLALGWGDDVAARADAWIFEGGHANHVPEAGHRRAFWESGLEVEVLQRFGWTLEPSPAMRAELEALHPDGSDVAAFTYRVVLRKPAAMDLRPGGRRGTPRAATEPTPPVSVVVPTPAGSPFLDAVRSALGQTLAPVEVIVAHSADDETTPALLALVAAGEPRLRAVAADGSGRGELLTAGLRAATCELVAALDAADVLLPHAFERLVRPLADAPDAVAAVGGWAPLDHCGVVAPGATRRLPADATVLLDGNVVGDRHLEAPDADREAFAGGLVRRSAVDRALGRAAGAASGPVLDDALWLAVLAQGPVAALAEVVRGRGRPDLLPEPSASPLDGELVALARSWGFRGRATGGGPARRPVALLLPVRDAVEELWAPLQAALATTHADLLDLVLVDASGGDLRTALEAVGAQLAEAFAGEVRLLGAPRGLDPVAAARELLPNPYAATVDDPHRLGEGWLVQLVRDLRATGAPVASAAGVTLHRIAAAPVARPAGPSTSAPREGAPAPLLLVGRFRSGTTFFANLLRQDPSHTVFLEPLHDQLAELVEGSYPTGDFGHVGVDDYWREYRALPTGLLRARWRAWFGQERLVLGRGDVAPELEAWIDALVDHAPGRAVLKLVRADFRTAWLRARYPEATIVQLWRPVREVWTSSVSRSPAPHQGFLGCSDRQLAALGLPAHAEDYELFYALSLLSASSVMRHADACWHHADAVADLAGWSGRNLVEPGLVEAVPSVPLSGERGALLHPDRWFDEREAAVRDALAAAVPAVVAADPSWRASLDDLLAAGGVPPARPLPAALHATAAAAARR